MKRALPLLLAGLASACVAAPPTNYAKGGAVLEIRPSRWIYGATIVDVGADGRVRVNGEHELSIDRAGRIFDHDAQPVALLEPDGRVIGGDDAPLGFVGADSASLPGHATAWISVMPSGEVVRYAEEGERTAMGVWVGGCNASMRAHQVCTLVTHLVGMRMQRRQSESPGLSIGIGIGVGIPLR